MGILTHFPRPALLLFHPLFRFRSNIVANSPTFCTWFWLLLTFMPSHRTPFLARCLAVHLIFLLDFMAPLLSTGRGTERNAWYSDLFGVMRPLCGHLCTTNETGWADCWLEFGDGIRGINHTPSVWCPRDLSPHKLIHSKCHESRINSTDENRECTQFSLFVLFMWMHFMHFALKILFLWLDASANKTELPA